MKFLEYMERSSDRYGFIYHSYCLMGNHFHLLLETPQANLSKGMHWLDSCYAGYFNWQHDHDGHVFQGRFQSILVQREGYLQELCRYIVLNPVRAGLTSHPVDYYWSSFREIAGIDSTGTGPTATDWILSLYSIDTSEAEALYAAYVMDGRDRPSPLKQVAGGTILGDKCFIEHVRDKVLTEIPLAKIPISQRDAFRPELDEHFRSSSILRTEERDDRIRSACNKWLYKRSEVAAFCGIAPSTVSMILKK